MAEYGESFAAAVAAELRAERARKGITFATLVEETGIAQSSIQRYLLGKRDIPMAAYRDLCKALGVDGRLIFERAESSIEGN